MEQDQQSPVMPARWAGFPRQRLPSFSLKENLGESSPDVALQRASGGEPSVNEEPFFQPGFVPFWVRMKLIHIYVVFGSEMNIWIKLFVMNS